MFVFHSSASRYSTVLLVSFGLASAFLPTLTMGQASVISTSALTPAQANQALLQPWGGNHGGVPAFDHVQVADFKPAMEAAMAENLAEINAIATNPQAPTFDNTIAALERSGRALDRVEAVYGVWNSTLNDPAFSTVAREMAPKLAAFSDQVTQNTALFKRIEAVYNAPETKKLTPEQQRLVEVRYRAFVRAGAKLDAPAKTRLSQINQQ